MANILKKYILKISFRLLFISTILYVPANAVDLKVKASIKSKEDGTYSAIIRNYVAAYSDTIKTYEKSHKINSGKWINDTSVDINPPTSASYNNKAIIFHKNYGSKYKSLNEYKKGDVYINYDTITGIMDTANENPYNYGFSFGNKNVVVEGGGSYSGKNPTTYPATPFNNSNSITKSLLNDGTSRIRWQVIQYKGCAPVVVNDREINQELLNEIIKDGSPVIFEEDDQGKYTRFSFVATTNDQRTDRQHVRTYGKTMATAAQYFYAVGRYWSSSNKGFTGPDYGSDDSYNGGIINGVTYGASKGTSIANQYDNILIIPVADLKKEVYVKHIVKDAKGNVKNINISNGQQLLDGKPVQSLGAKKGYQESYEFNKGSSITVNRSTTLASDGKQYKLVDSKCSSASTLKEAENNLKNTTNKGKSQYSIGFESAQKVTVVEFYYEENNISDPTGKIKIEEDSAEVCKIFNVPIGSTISPYVVANKFMITDIKFYLGNDGKYYLSEYKVNKLSSANMYLKDRKPISGTSKEALFEGNKSTIDIIEKNINDAINKQKNSLSGITTIPESIASVESTSANDCNSQYTISMDKYNGIREIYGDVIYNKVNVLKGKVESYSSKVINNIEVNPKINVYAPLGISVKTETGKIVDHTTGSNGFIVQRDAEITITPEVTLATQKYLNYYYVIMDFDADNLTSGGHIKAGTAVRVDKGKALKIKATSGTESGDIIAQVNNKIKVIGVTVNMPDKRLENQVLQEEGRVNATGGFESVSNVRYVDEGSIKIPEATCKIDEDDYSDRRHIGYYCGNMFRDAYYFARVTSTSKNIGRIYDFKITDCTDINFKNVFRVTSGNSVNALTGNTYVSGDKKLYIYKGQNFLIPLSNLGITGTKAKKILPLGPYKNTNSSYVQAPKMGYRISFDLKTSGYFAYNENTERSSRKIVITPSYYYISKDGKTVIDNITLYYKDSSGKYVNFKNSNYTIYFKPNDGYRFKYNSDEAGNTKWMSSQLEPLVIGKESFELNYKMMTSSGNDFIQAWYGEFKLPNSTIAVGGGASINNPLTNGYVGVKFKIDCVDQNGVTVSYNENDKGADQLKNTTQWDYEGYLGYSGVGRDLTSKDDIKLQLEKGVYQIDTQAKYEQFKSTVVLFDLDNRAANDFE